MVAIVGKSGSGKTILLNIIGLLDMEYTGSLRLHGTSFLMKSYNKRCDFISEHINYLFQNYALVDSESVEDNLMYHYMQKNYKKDKKTAIKEALCRVGLKDMAHKKVYELSGGEQQRVALARLMLKQGDIILADEPTGNLDQKNKEVVLSILKELNSDGKSVVIVTYDMEIANLCDRIIRIA